MMYLKRLRDLREDHDLTQEKIAQKINITQRAYAFYEKGDRDIPIEVLIKLADYYNVSIDYIVGRCDTKKDS